MHLHTFRSASWRLLVAPEVEASIPGLHARSGDDWLAVLREVLAEAIENRNPTKFAGFILAPFSNRVRDARFTFLGGGW